jgi:hypothetical protein
VKTKWLIASFLVLALGSVGDRLLSQEITGNLRLVDNFIQDGAVLRQGWLEAGASYADWGDGHDSTVSARVAFSAMEKMEFGGTFSYLDRTRSDGDVLFGEKLSSSMGDNGPGDINLYGKFRFKTAPRDWSAGLIVKLPTADEGERLGSGSTDYELFLATRQTSAKHAWVGSTSLRWNGDARTPGGSSGRTSVAAGGGMIFKMSYSWSFLAEARYETRRYDGGDVDFRIVPTFDFRPTENLAFRLGFAFGLADGSPNRDVTFGAVFHF